MKPLSGLYDFPRSRIIAILALLLALPMSQLSMALAPIQNIEDSVVPDGFTAAQVKKSIETAGAKRKWRFKDVAPGHMKALQQSRGHSATIDVHFDAKKYSLRYKSSTNLHYENGKIHKTFNKWLKTLDRDIQTQFELELFER